MLRLRQLRDLLMVLDCGSIRAASARLGVSQPAVTKSIRSLEAELGVQLVHRTTSGVTPTAAGTAFAARARVAQLELERAREEVLACKGEGASSLSLGVASAAMVLVATQAIIRFRQVHSLARMHVVEGPGPALLPLVRDGSIDAALVQRVAPASAPGLTYRPLLRTRLSVLCRVGHPLSRARTFAELGDADWLAFRPPNANGALEAAMKSEGLPFPSRYVLCESLALMLGLLRGSDALALLVPQILQDPIGASLQEIPMRRPLPEISIGMYCRADTPASAAWNDFRGHLLRGVRELARRS